MKKATRPAQEPGGLRASEATNAAAGVWVPSRGEEWLRHPPHGPPPSPPEDWGVPSRSSFPAPDIFFHFTVSWTPFKSLCNLSVELFFCHFQENVGWCPFRVRTELFEELKGPFYLPSPQCSRPFAAKVTKSETFRMPGFWVGAGPCELSPRPLRPGVHVPLTVPPRLPFPEVSSPHPVPGRNHASFPPQRRGQSPPRFRDFLGGPTQALGASPLPADPARSPRPAAPQAPVWKAGQRQRQGPDGDSDGVRFGKQRREQKQRHRAETKQSRSGGPSPLRTPPAPQPAAPGPGPARGLGVGELGRRPAGPT